MKRFSSIAALTALLLTAAACGDDSTSASTDSVTPSETAVATTVADTAVETTGDSASTAGLPSAIISLSPTHTEMLFAIGAADQILAVDDQSNFPAAALDKPHELSGYEPNVEAIAALNPDLVIIADDFSDLSGQLEALGIPVWSGPSPITFDDVYAQIEQLGAATGHIGEAAELVGQMQTDIDAAISAAPVMAEPASYYHELDNTLYSVTSNTFIGQVYGLFGLTNIADGVEAGNDYPQLNAEFIIQANPDLIFLADSKCCGESPDTVAARDGWGSTNAVTNGNVIAIDDDIASRWGPRLVDFVQAVSDAIAKVPAKG
jgi:iron complex transport system substrate-binding protein